MKKKISIIILFFLIMSLFLVTLSFCTDDTSEENEIVYQQGYVHGSDIGEKFELVGERHSRSCAGSNGTQLIYCQQTASGGWVAWSSARYIYTEENISAAAILNKAMIEFMTPLDL